MVPLIRGAPSSIHGWKTRFLFVSRSDGEEWGFPSWGRLREAAVREPLMDDKLKEDLKMLDAFDVPELKHLLSEETLFNVGLSLVKPQGM